MIKKTLLTVTGFLLFNLSYSQNQEKYNQAINEAMSLYDSKEFAASAAKFKAAFDELDGKANPTDRYNAACSYSLAGNIDTAFYHLLRLANDSKYDNYSHITIDPDLKPLYEDPKWEELLSIVKSNKEKAEANFNKPLVAILDSVYQDDQKYRQQIKGIEEKYGWESAEMKAHWKIIAKNDSINVIKIKKILDEHGWLGADVIGKKGNSTLFLVIQHSDIQTQQKYLPMMREAVKVGNAHPAALALLEDRVALREGKKQIYGSQIGQNQETGEHYVQPLEDPDNVDKRRAEVGLGKLQDYISRWGLTWDPEEYKKQLAEMEAKK